MQSICIYYSIFLSIIYFIFIRKKREKVEWKIQNLNFFALFIHSFINSKHYSKICFWLQIFFLTKKFRDPVLLYLFLISFKTSHNTPTDKNKKQANWFACLSKFLLKLYYFIFLFIFIT